MIYVLCNVDDVMPHVAKLGNVLEIYFQDSGSEDRHVSYVNGLSILKSLLISDTKITDLRVAQLAGMNFEVFFWSGLKSRRLVWS